MFRLIVFAVSLVLCASARGVDGRRSPNADLIEQYYKFGPEAGRFSDNVLEDALLDVPDLIRKYRYPMEVHEVTTEDGYLLDIVRIPHGRDRNNVRDPKKPVVFVMHGLLGSCADWVIMGPGTGLAYLLAEAGYDVWLGNARGTYYSRKHVTLDPDLSEDRFWRFSWDEIGRLDLPAMIDHVLETTGKSRIHYIGHSQGTVAFWVMTSLLPEYNAKFISMQAFGPVAYLEYNANRIFKLLAPHANNLEMVASYIGFNEFIPRNPFVSWVGSALCSDESRLQPVCSNILFLLAGHSADMHNATMFPVKLAHTPAGASVRQIVHFAQHIGQNFFRRFDHGAIENRIRYGSWTPPLYDLSKITTPVYFHYAELDSFADLRDLDKLHKELGRPPKRMVPHANFSHLDFAWGSDARSVLFEPTIKIMDSLGSD